MNDGQNKARPSQTAALIIQRHLGVSAFLFSLQPIANTLSLPPSITPRPHSRVSLHFQRQKLVLVLRGAWWVCVFSVGFLSAGFQPWTAGESSFRTGTLPSSGGRAASEASVGGTQPWVITGESTSASLLPEPSNLFWGFFPSFFFFEVVNFDPLPPFSKHQR